MLDASQPMLSELAARFMVSKSEAGFSPSYSDSARDRTVELRDFFKTTRRAHYPEMGLAMALLLAIYGYGMAVWLCAFLRGHVDSSVE